MPRVALQEVLWGRPATTREIQRERLGTTSLKVVALGARTTKDSWIVQTLCETRLCGPQPGGDVCPAGANGPIRLTQQKQVKGVERRGPAGVPEAAAPRLPPVVDTTVSRALDPRPDDALLLPVGECEGLHGLPPHPRPQTNAALQPEP